MERHVPEPIHISRALYQTIARRLPSIHHSSYAEGAGWIPTISSVLDLENNVGVRVESLALFHRLTSTVKSLRKTFITVSPSQIINFIHSFPLLVDISVRNTFRGYP